MSGGQHGTSSTTGVDTNDRAKNVPCSFPLEGTGIDVGHGAITIGDVGETKNATPPRRPPCNYLYEMSERASKVLMSL